MQVLSHSMQVREKPGEEKEKAVASYEKVVTFGPSFYGFARFGALWEAVVRLGAKLSNIEQIYGRKARNSKKCHLSPPSKLFFFYQQTTLY